MHSQSKREALGPEEARPGEVPGESLCHPSDSGVRHHARVSHGHRRPTGTEICLKLYPSSKAESLMHLEIWYDFYLI